MAKNIQALISNLEKMGFTINDIRRFLRTIKTLKAIQPFVFFVDESTLENGQ